MCCIVTVNKEVVFSIMNTAGCLSTNHVRCEVPRY